MGMAKDFLDITREKFNEAVREAKPLIVGYNFTMACNLKCKRCATGADEPWPGELSTEEAFRVIDNLADAGVMHISFGGGEPTVRKDLFEVAEYASRYIPSVGVVTNGYLVDEDFALQLAEAGVKQVMISLDGIKAETHDLNRGKGSFDKAIQAIADCKEMGLLTRISFTINKANYHDLHDVVDYAMSSGLTLHVQEFAAVGRGVGHEDLVLTRGQRREMQRYLYNAQKQYGPQRIGFENRYIISEDKDTQRICTDQSLGSGFYDFCVGCLTGIYSFFLSGNGQMMLCGRYALGSLGDLRKEKLANIWRNSEILNQVRNRDNLKGRCGKCTYRYICGGCRAIAHRTTGDYMEGDPACWRGRKEEELSVTGHEICV